MKSTTAKFKQIMAAATARDYLIKIDLTLADNTVLHLTEADIWEDSFSIETASSGTSSFDIGCAVIGKCTFTINNINGDFDSYDFFNANAVVWLGLVGDATGTPAVQQYYRMGYFTVDEPEKANGLIALSLLDYMWKFDVPLSGVTLNYPVTAINAVNALCSYCGVTLAGTSANFHGYNFSIAEAPKDVDNMNCREMLQYIAMIGCNFCAMNDEGKLEIKWYDVNATASTTDVFDYNQSTSFGTEDITITGVKFVIDNTAYSVGSSGYVLELENPLVTASNVTTVLNLIWDVLDSFTLRTYKCSCASDLAAEIGDKVKIRDYQGNYVYSWITLNSFKLAGHEIQCNAEAPNRTLVKRYSKTVQAAVEVARQQTNEIISNYDLAVQMMNDLAVNSMGGYEDYEDLSTGGRVWYLSNMPITKVNNVCSFEPNSTVYKKSGSGFFVSRDGGITWVNGYDAQTGELVVNVLDAIGINFDWARGGTLTLGGYGNGHGQLSIQDDTNVEKVHGDNTGLKVGATTGSKIFINTDGEMQYLYNNSYSGKLRMEAHNRGTEQTPDIVDSLAVRDFDSIRFSSDYAGVDIESYSNSTGSIKLSAESTSSNNGNVSVSAKKIYLSDGAISLDSDNSFSAVHVDTDVIDLGSPDEIHVGNSVASASDNGYVLILDNSGKAHACFLNRGIITGWTAQGTDVLDYWHTWTASGTTYSAIILVVGNTTADFPDIDTSLHYDPYIECANGVSPPKITDMVINGTTLTVTFTEVTSAQTGSGQTSACVIKLRTIV